MENNLTSIVHQWLLYSDIAISKSYLTHKLQSHPAYPSILSITDTLDEWGIENAALVTDKEKFNQLPAPFLVHTNKKGTPFTLITNSQQFLVEQPTFLTHWNGIAIVLNKPAFFDDATNNTWLQKEKIDRKLKRTGFLILLLITTLAASLQFNWLTITVLVTTLAGLTVATLIAQHELGIDNLLTETLCSTSKKTDCNAVIQSSQSKLAGRVNFSDLGISWYYSLYLIITISLFTNSFTPLLPLISLLNLIGLPLTFFSLYYQRFVIKRWCPLCLMTVAIMWIQTGLLFPQLSLFQFSPELLRSVGFTATIIIPTFTLWAIVLKPLLKKGIEMKDLNFRLQRFRYDGNIFETALHSAPPIDSKAWANDLQLGNPFSSIQILVACNPYCAPCSSTHLLLHEIAERRDIGLTIRFALKVDKQDKIFQAGEYILSLLKDKSSTFKRKCLHDWYASMNMDVFIRAYPLHDHPDITDLCRQHEAWTKKVGIKFTPTIFINGYQLPAMYTVSDLPLLIGNLINKSVIPDNVREQNR